jgi:penicillin-binding protein 2
LVYNIPGFRENVKGKTVLISQEKALDLIAKGKSDLEIDSLRQYPYKDATAHILGYLGQISPDQLKNNLFSGYLATDVIGQDGVEQFYEQNLKGEDGKQLFEINSAGSVVRKLGQNEPISGENVTLTVDLDLQKKAYEAMSGVLKGAAVVQNPRGEILAMVSRPSFDPNLFTMDDNYKASDSQYKNLESILTDGQSQPLLNRAISGVYPPGSTFKIVVASAALKSKVIDENYQVEDTGIMHVGTFSFSNWYYTEYGGKDGDVNVVKAIKRSNDIFFYQLAAKTGIDKISDAAAKFGVGQKLGIDLSGEARGILPSVEWKEKNIKEQWYLGDTYHYGIGQGFLLTTPLQVSAWTQAIANSGKLYEPHILKNKPQRVLSENLLDNYSFNLIRQGMIESCSPGGVAWPFFNFAVNNQKLVVDNKNILPYSSGSAQMRQVVVACKTGTAEDGDKKPHAWITLFAPAYNPQVIVTVLSENSGEGSNIAGPVARKILEAYFAK